MSWVGSIRLFFFNQHPFLHKVGLSNHPYLKLWLKSTIWPNMVIFGPKRVKMIKMSWVGSIRLLFWNQHTFLHKVGLSNHPYLKIWLKPTIWPNMVIFGPKRIKIVILSWVGSIRLLFLNQHTFLHKVGLSKHPYPKFWLKPSTS